MSSTTPSTLNPNPRMTQIGIRCSRTRKCLQRYEIDHFCQGNLSGIQPSEIPLEIPPEQPAEILFEIRPEILLYAISMSSTKSSPRLQIFPNNNIYGRSIGYVQQIAKNTKSRQDAQTNSKTKPQFHHPRKTPLPTSLSSFAWSYG